MCVCLSVRTLKGKRLELRTPNVVHILYGRTLAYVDILTATQLRKPSRLIITGCPAAAVCMLLLLPVWDCTSYDCLGFWFFLKKMVRTDLLPSFQLRETYTGVDGVAVVTDLSMHTTPGGLTLGFATH